MPPGTGPVSYQPVSTANAAIGQSLPPPSMPPAPEIVYWTEPVDAG